MNLTPIIGPFLLPILMLILFGIIFAICRTPWFKGGLGEFIVNISAKFFLDKEKYHLIKNVTLPTDNGTTQIDHIIVSKFGVFVIETKNMKGWIFGGEHQKTWTQQIFKYSNSFQNPLRQNYKHTKTLESLLELNEGKTHSLVVFVGDSEFKTDMPEDVTYGKGYLRYIKSKTEEILTEDNVKDIISKINSGRLEASFKTNREHVKHVKNIIAGKDDKNSTACPKCGASMVIRTAKKRKNKGNQFWGCPNFPKCRGTRDIT